MINTALPASNSVYGREKLFWYDKTNVSNHVCHCGAVVKEFLARAVKPGSTPGDAAFCFFVPFFSLFGVFFLNTFFPFGLFFFILTADPAGYALGSIYFKLKSGVLFWKRDFKTLDLHTGQAYDQIKTISCQDMSLLWNSWIFFNVSWHHDKQTQYTTNCTNLQPTPTSDPPAKVKLAFCTSSILLISIYIYY